MALSKTRRAHVLSEEEQIRALTIIGTQSRYVSRDKAIFALSHCAGLRVSEIAALNVADVAELGGQRTGPKTKSETTLTKTKGDKPRIVFLDSPLLGKALNQYLTERIRAVARGSKDAPIGSQPLFLTQKGNRFNTSTMCQLFQRIYGPAWADVKNAKGHSGRRTYITNLAERGYNLKAIAQLAGHSNIQTTAIYIDTNPLQLKRMAASATNPKLERYL